MSCSISGREVGLSNSMNLRTFVTFQWQTAPMPDRDPYDDCIWIAPPRSDMPFHIGQYLVQRGFLLTRLYSDHDSDLAFGIVSGGVRVCCVVKEGQPSLLATEVQGWSKTSPERRNPLSEHSRVCAALHECLTKSGRATAVNWYTRKDFERGNVEAGADRP
jgi:hypothetical protein